MRPKDMNYKASSVACPVASGVNTVLHKMSLLSLRIYTCINISICCDTQMPTKAHHSSRRSGRIAKGMRRLGSSLCFYRKYSVKAVAC